MPPNLLAVLNAENRRTNGIVERYIYVKFNERQSTVGKIIAAIEAAKPATFQLKQLLELFEREQGIRRSVDKAYEIVTHSLFETVVTALGTTVKVSVPTKNKDLLREFSDLARVLLGIDENQLEREQLAHVYRVGVTNAADRGLDMWANFGPAVQVKHLTLNPELATTIVDQVESEHIVIVCRDADANALTAFTKQIGWGRRVRGIVTESDLIQWYERCLRGKFAQQLAKSLLQHLIDGFRSEFPQKTAIVDFMDERGYLKMKPEKFWWTETDEIAIDGK